MFKPTHYMKKSRGIMEGFYLIPVIIERVLINNEYFVRDMNNNAFIASSTMLIDAKKLENAVDRFNFV